MNFPILIHGNAPWVPSGYGQQNAIFGTALSSLGHRVGFSANWGLQGAPIQWGGMPVFPSQHEMGLAPLAKLFFGDEDGLFFGLLDAWFCDPEMWSLIPGNVALWAPEDGDRTSAADLRFFGRAPNVKVVAMSRKAQKDFAKRGIAAEYVPHAVDTTVFTPDGDDFRGKMPGIGQDTFVIGINAANSSTPSRKAFDAQFAAFARFRKRHPDSKLLVHSAIAPKGGISLLRLAEALGIEEDVIMSDQVSYLFGMHSREYLATWYRTLDLFSNVSLGEGFGIPTVEAQACGVPVVVTDAAASSELVGAGWKLKGHPYWNNVHESFWSAVEPEAIAEVYEKATKRNPTWGRTARSFAEKFSLERVLADYFLPAIEKLGPS